MDKVLVDSSGFIAVFNRRDQYHAQGLEIYKQLRDAKLYTSNYILSELYTRLLPKVGIYGVRLCRQALLKAESQRFLTIEWIDKESVNQAWQYFDKFSEHQLSFTDATSYLLVKKYKLDAIFTFDSDFKEVGLSVLS